MKRIFARTILIITFLAIIGGAVYFGGWMVFGLVSLLMFHGMRVILIRYFRNRRDELDLTTFHGRTLKDKYNKRIDILNGRFQRIFDN